MRKHVEGEDKTTVAICDTGYVDDEDGMKRPTIDSLGINYKRDDVAKRDTITSSLYP